MRKFLSMTLMFISIALSAQIKPTPQMDFAHFDKNKIIFQSDSSSFERIYSKMDSLRSGQETDLRVLYIGGSHIQGGSLTRQVRNNLLSMAPGIDGGRGLLFPFSVAKTNNPTSFVTKYEGKWTSVKNVQKEPAKRLGLTGMAIVTSDTLSTIKIKTVPRDTFPGDAPAYFSEINVLGTTSNGDLKPMVLLENGDTLRGAPTMSDSCLVFNLPFEVDSVRFVMDGKSGEYTLTGIYLNRPNKGVTVSGVGVNGAAVSSFMKCEDFERDLSLVKPDLVIFGIGINDAVVYNFSPDSFVARYHLLVDKVKAVSPDCALLFVTNNDSFRHSRKRGYYVNSNGPLAEKAFLTLGKEYGAGVWDLFDIMGGLGSMKKWEQAGYAKRDKIHFTDKGYSLIGDLLYNSLFERYSEYIQNR